MAYSSVHGRYFTGKQMTASNFKGLDASGSDLGNVTASISDIAVPLQLLHARRVSLGQLPKRSKQFQRTKLLKGAVDHEFQHNARPVQDLNGRTVTQFEDKDFKKFKQN
ncbi:hypothetical protein HanHA89_Chr02g0046461 [Helianthus annuus]|nr:hypothetical protein HanHA89_Chr02g0046461 [Helianthus annuus]